VGAFWYLSRDNKLDNNSNDNEKEPEKETWPKKYDLDMLMVGDVLIHGYVYQAAKTGDTYNFDPMFDNVRNIIKNYDLAFYNQETPFGGKSLGYRGYPTFNTPSEIGDTMLNMGFNLVSLATNHTMDMGGTGAINALGYWNNQKDILTAGSYLSEEARDEIKIQEKNNIKYTMLAYTASTNLGIPSSKPYLLNKYDKEKVKEDIERVRDKVDLLIVSMHWGEEYKLQPNEQQKEIAAYLASLGVDIVIGTHTHSVQPIEYIGSTLVFYSLGNFISNQPNYDDLIGLMPALKITKTVNEDNTSTMQLSDLQANLVYTYYEGKRGAAYRHTGYKVMPFDMVTDTFLPNYKTYYDKYIGVIQTFDDTIKVGAIEE
jgi:poly-gamma-glutamate synthesis protein (capsule biosynthesis protein)